ncbi:aldehyde dehydrogenase [Reticulibacter mediterranei]|uniref:Aldehyde dehydrogenase n=1 Tax=Reticulibacter mediterranei TaxID=2778369 RepID=A0A8J3IJW2_9CHLR|nr:xanthine dehydrogenase family protein molybdopterin-binding subunit [Reticulibacter mediterranei]GHO95088.1 aldehyde dehydrogenase [Reticulibacter mediterranei]
MTKIPAGLERRREDLALITGHGRYVDDLRPAAGRPPALHIAFVRSPYAHAEIGQISLDAALALPGVVAAFTSPELASTMRPIEGATIPGSKRPERRPLAIGKARYTGDPVAVVLAENRYLAVDARDLVDVDYEPLPAVIDIEAALAPAAPLLYEEFGSNVGLVAKVEGGDIEAAFAQADRTLLLRLVNQRLVPGSLETRACMFDFDPESGQLTAWLSSQSIFRARETLANFLGLDKSRIHVQNADVGGGFGAKNAFLGEEQVTAALAMRLGRPIKWIEDRTENLIAQTHGRGQISYVEAAFQNDGRLLAIKARTVGDIGAFVAGVSPAIHARTGLMLNGPYQVQAIESITLGAFTNKAPTNAYRGAGRPEAAYILERVIDRIAHVLELDPAVVRSRNFLPPDVFPYRTVTGVQYDSGNYQAALDRLLELGDYQGWREKQRERRASNSDKLLGIGLATPIELSGDAGAAPGPREAATVRIRPDGTLLVQSGVSHNGQGHFTAFAQIVANTLHVPAEQVEVQMNDTALPAFSIGTFGSRVTQMAGSVVLLAAEAVREKALQVAAHVLEAALADLVLEDGRVFVRGTPAHTVDLGTLARLVEEQPTLIEQEPPNPVNGAPIAGLAAWRSFAAEGASYSSGAHLAIVEVESETGNVSILSYVAVDDCGRVLNHYLTEAQIQGSLAQGVGQALYEEVVYDEESGQPLTATLMDYALPSAEQIPDFVTDFVETPSPFNPLGAKGAGEAGCIAAPPTIVNAVLDALAPLGIATIDMPLKPEKIWTLIQSARQGKLAQHELAFPEYFTRHTQQ